MDKKKIISTTLMFLAIVASIVLFKLAFGEENSLVAVTGITAALSLLGMDYTINPIQNTIYFVCLEVIIGLAAFLASLNAILGLVITFIMVFYILYTFTYDNKRPIYVGFTLGYFFMLYSPVTLEGLPLRLWGLVVCGLAIMVLQFLFNTNRIKKLVQGQIKAALKMIQEEVALIETRDDTAGLADLNHNAHKSLKSLIETLYEYIDKDAKLPVPVFQKLFIAHFLDSLNIQIKEAVENDYIKNIKSFKALKILLNHIELFINDKENVDNLITALENFLAAFEFIKSKGYVDLELITSASILKKDLIHTLAHDVSKLYSQYFVTNLVDRIRSIKNNMTKDSARFTFAFRGALITSIGVFIVSLFNIESGKWIIFSLHAIVQPYLDYSKKKGNQRLLGTVIGLVIFEIVFSTFTSTSIRMLLILLVGYLSNYQTDYTGQVICMTISALGAASIGTNIRTVGAERLIYVVVGTCVALYANKVILPFKVSDATKKDIGKSIGLNKKIIEMLYEKCIGTTGASKELNTLINVNRFMNKKIEYNNQLISSGDINEYIYNQHIFMNDIRILSNLFMEATNKHYSQLELLEDMNYLTDEKLSKDDILKYIDEIDDTFIQIILINMLKLKKNIYGAMYLLEMIEQTV
ncbi:MAG: FUSC family protein [Cellulosilyticum sp.]|nr:FUSC family protein [Cellulosilyticum sp.]